MYKKGAKIGFGFCSYFDEELGELGDYEPIYEDGEKVENLALFPSWRIRGYAAALRIKAIDVLVLMGMPKEIDAYANGLLSEGIDRNVSLIKTNNSTSNAALTLAGQQEELAINGNQWTVLSSNYHLERIRLTALKLHNFHIPELIGAEDCLLREAFIKGGKEAMHQLLEEMVVDRDHEEEQRRLFFEQMGCAQLMVAPNSYRPKKASVLEPAQ